jgi:hypothetical protein
LTHRYPKSAIKRNHIVFVFLVTTLLMSLSAVVFLIDNGMNLAFASKKREDSSSSGSRVNAGGSDNGRGGESNDNGGESDNSNGAGSTDSTSPPTKETIAPPTEPTAPAPPASTEQTCPDGSKPDANGLCPVLTDNSGQATPDSSSSTASATIPNKGTKDNSTNGGSSGAASLTTPSDSTTGSNTNGGSDKNNTPPAAATTPDSSSGTAISTPPSPPNQDTSSSSTSASSSSAADTKPSNAKTPQTGVSQSAAIAATNQIINSPGSTIVNQQSIKQSVKINNEINNIIRKNVISSPSSTTTSTTIAEEKPISNLITVKLATTTSAMSRNAYLPLADVAPYHLIGGHVTANLPSNHLYVVVAQLVSSNGAIQHAVVLDMIRSQISNIYETDLGSQISGTNPLTGKQDVVSDITNLFLWNNGNQQVTFVDANGVTMNLIYK